MPESYTEQHTHCWHREGREFTSYPPQWKERCCWCGATRHAHQEYVTPEGHGPHAPKVARTRYDNATLIAFAGVLDKLGDEHPGGGNG